MSSRDYAAGGIKPGDQFEQLTALSAERKPYGIRGNMRWMWTCSCICGAIVEVPVGNLKNGNSKSCGCRIQARIKKARTTHGFSNERTTGRPCLPEYNSWSAMKARCYTPTNPKFKHYGARGIKVCEQWLHSFETFYHDMGPKPSPHHTIDRENNDGNYEPGNCRWATPTQQAGNRRMVRINTDLVRAIRKDGRPRAVVAAELGVSPGHIADIKRGKAWAHVV